MADRYEIRLPALQDPTGQQAHLLVRRRRQAHPRLRDRLTCPPRRRRPSRATSVPRCSATSARSGATSSRMVRCCRTQWSSPSTVASASRAHATPPLSTTPRWANSSSRSTSPTRRETACLARRRPAAQRSDPRRRPRRVRGSRSRLHRGRRGGAAVPVHPGQQHQAACPRASFTNCSPTLWATFRRPTPVSNSQLR